MGLRFKVGLLVVLAMCAFAQNSGRVRAGEDHPPPLRGEIHTIADPAPMRSFQALCEKADAIVEGVVESQAARMLPGRGARIDTDFWVAVDRVLKGPANSRKIVVSEMGGTVGELHVMMNFPLLQLGKRYVLFLYTDKRPGSPPVPGLPRYIAEIFYGTYIVGASNIRTFFNPAFEGRYEGWTTEAFAAEIAANLKP